MWLLAAAGWAWGAPVEQDFGSWESINLSANLHGEAPTGLRLWSDAHFRRWDSQFLAILRPGLGWDLSRQSTVFLGYAWIPSVGDATAGELFQEHRLWAQLLWQHAPEKLQLGFRPRLEQRWALGQEPIAFRLRLWGRVGWSLSERVSLVATDEVFLGLGETTWTPGGFDQNRAFFGPALHADWGRVEVGYLNVFLQRDPPQDLHLASTNLFLSF